MTKGIGMLNNQKVKKVISEWGMWWRWLMHSPPVWQASLEGLKVITIVPNPLGISPQTQVSCGWRRVHMHKCWVPYRVGPTHMHCQSSFMSLFQKSSMQVFSFNEKWPKHGEAWLLNEKCSKVSFWFNAKAKQVCETRWREKKEKKEAKAIRPCVVSWSRTESWSTESFGHFCMSSRVNK